MGNQYCTTLHAINSSILKLSTLTKVTNVYRGLGGGVLPPAFLEQDARGIRGGCDFAFLSATTDREVWVQDCGAVAWQTGGMCVVR